MNIFKIIYICVLLFALSTMAHGQSNLLNLDNNAVVSITNNALIKVNGNLIVSSGASLSEVGDAQVNISGDLENNGSITSDAGEVAFVGTGSSELKGSAAPDLNDLRVNKDNTSDYLYLDNDANLTGNLNVESGIFQFVNTQSRTLDIDGNLNITANSELDVQTTFITHSLNLAGDLQNNGRLDLRVLNGRVDVTFDGSGNSVLYGSGATTDFASIFVNKDNATDEVQVSPLGQNLINFTAPDGFLNLTQGVFHFLGEGVLTFSNTFFTPTANVYNIPAGSGLWLENSGITVAAQDASLQLSGLLRIDGADYNIGSGVLDHSLFYTDGAELNIGSGNLDVNTSICRSIGQDNSALTFTMSGGQINLASVRSAVNSRAVFDIGYANSIFNWSAGDIVLNQNSGVFANSDYYVKTTNGSVTGGRLIIESASATDLNQEFGLNSDMPLGELLMTADNNPRVDLVSDITVIGDVTLTHRGITASSFDLTLGGQWINNSATPTSFDYGTGNVIFNGAIDQIIGGSQSTDFYGLIANKTGGNLIINHDLDIYSSLRLISNTILDMQSNDITIAENAEIYSDFGTNQDFNSTKYLMNSGGATGGRLIRMIENNPYLPMAEFIVFPVGTPGAYTFAWIRPLNGTYNSNPGIVIRAVPQEHPQVKKNNVSLAKYWEISTVGNVSPGVEGTTLRFLYDQTEVQGSEGNYHIIQYAGGGWHYEPALSNNIDFGLNYIRPERFSGDFSGDWTAGEEDAVAAKYYSIADGNYNDPSIWSRNSYGDPTPSITAPNSDTDIIFIGDDKTVTLTGNTPPARRIQIDSTGTFMCGSYVVSSTVDTFLIKAGGGIGIGHSGSLAQSANDGNVRASFRYYSNDAMYIFTGNNNQILRDIPSRVSALVITKDNSANTVTMNKNIVIGDSLIINEGVLDQVNDSYFLDGEAPGKFFTMRGGRLILKDEFPSNYLPVTLEGGTLDFYGVTGITVPSDASNPAVLRYNNLTFRGDRGYNKVTFSPSGQINITGNLDISNADFANFSETWLSTNGSTIAFIGDGNQNIPRNSSLNNQWGRLNYYNLIIGGTGNKTLVDNIDYIVTNDITLNSGTFVMANGNNRLEVSGDWTNNGGDFDYGTNQTVLFKSISGVENQVASNNVPFYDVDIDGQGVVRFTDEMTVENEIQINSGATFGGGNSATLHVLGVWDNNGNQFDPGNSTVSFDGNATQTINTLNYNEEVFYNLTINSGDHVDVNAGGGSTPNRLWVKNNLHLERGYLYLPDFAQDYIRVDGNATRNSSDNNTSFVHANYRQYVNRDTGVYFIPVGYSGGINAYSGIELEMKSNGGTEGYLNIYTDDTPANSPRFNEINRKWEFSIPATSTFDLGIRTYDVVFNFHPNDAVGMNTAVFETRRRVDGINWVAPNTGVKTATSTESLDNNILAPIGSVTEFIVGESSYSIFYSVANGDWSSPATWSTVGWGGPPEVVVTPLATDSVRIGDGFTVNLDLNFTIDVDKAVVVETAGVSSLPGRLELGTNQISGAGAFVVKSGGILGIGDPNGITAAAASGNIRTTTRDYNFNNNNHAYFIYNSTSAQVTGDGLPNTVGGFVANSTVGLTLSKPVTVLDSFLIESNSLDVSASDHKLTIASNWINQGTFIPRNGTVEFSGNSNKELTNVNNQGFYNLTINKSNSRVDVTDNSVTVANNLNFTSGVLNTRLYSQTVIVDNGATVSRTSGHVDGEMRKYLSTGDLALVRYEVGYGTDYTPVDIDVNGTAGTAGFIGVVSNDGDHPEFLTSALNPDKNVQRYWSLNSYGFDLGATRTYDITLNFLYPDDIRGGADPSAFEVRRYNLGWNIPVNGLRTNSSTQATGISQFGIDFMVGEPGGSGRVFYSIASGAWNTVGNWSEISYGGVASSNYPDQNTDIIFIGDNKYIDLDASRQVSSITVENSGKLNLSDYVITGTQFILKKDGILEIASPDGITASGATGNIQTSIRNYNHSNHNSARLIYSGNAVSTGDGIPDNIADVIFNTSGTILLEKDLSVADSVLISSGTVSANNFDLSLGGDFVNNSGFIPTTSALAFTGDTDQYLTGTSSINLNILELNKTAGNLELDNDITIGEQINFLSDANIILNQNDITISQNASIIGTNLGSNQMIVADGTVSSGRVIKNFTDGAAASRSIDIPIGIGSNYYGAEIDLVADFVSAQLDIRVINGKHPDRRPGYDNVLEKYWTVNTSGISNIQDVPGTNYKFNYQTSDLNGTASLYGAARYTGFGWDIDLGATTTVNPSPIDVKQYQTLDGDWTAGYPNSFRSGQIYYSIASGNWDNNLTWSNVSHSGDASRFYPGRLENDTVYISSNDEVDFNVSNSEIGMLTISEDGSYGRLDFNDSQNQSLRVKQDFFVGIQGRIEQYGSGNRYDTLFIGGNITNNTTAEVDFYHGGDDHTILKIVGTGNTIVSGSGNWDFYDVYLDKEGGLSDTLINQSTGFTAQLDNDIDNGTHFYLQSGVYRHDVNLSLQLDNNNVNNDGSTWPDNDSQDFRMGDNAGLHILQSTVYIYDDLHAGANNSFLIDGGNLIIGSGNNENFVYGLNNKFEIRSGTFTVAACFTPIVDPTSYEALGSIDMVISGGISTVMDIYSNQTKNIYGFGLLQNSTLTWSGGTLIYSHPTNGGFDYVVKTSTYSITGGTLQFGEPGNWLGSGQRHSFGSVTPVYNLIINECRQSNGRHSSCILAEDNNYVLNDLIIESNGTLDLDGRNLYVGGDFINEGRFSPDGRGWNDGGSRIVTFNGTGDQIFQNSNSYTNSQSGNSMNNEPFFEVVIDKPSGNLILGDYSRSYMQVRNTMIFAENNTAVIDARTNDHYLQMTPRNGSDLEEVQRLGIGHVDGKLIQNFYSGTVDYRKYHIGAGDDYTPAELEFHGTYTNGPIDLTAFGTDPAGLADNDESIDLTRNIQRYWSIEDNGSFSLSSANFDLTLHYLNPADFRNSSNWTLYKQFRFPLPPGPAPVDYFQIDNVVRTDTTTKSLANSVFGNYMIAELTGTRYYSVSDGIWDDPATWSKEGYGGTPETFDFPRFVGDEAYIGDGHTVTLSNLVSNIKSTVVETYQGSPGTLKIQDDGWITGQSFVLKDSCYLATQHNTGLQPEGVDDGSVRTVERVFGVANYIFNSDIDFQVTGSALPDYMLSLTVNNTAAAQGFRVLTSNNSKEITIYDSLNVVSGLFDAGSGVEAYNIRGGMYFGTQGDLKTNTRVFDIEGNNTQYITMDKNDSIRFRQLNIYKTAAPDSVIFNARGTDSHIRITNRLRFGGGNQAYIKILNDARIVLNEGASIERQGATPFGHIDGFLSKTMAAGAVTKLFEVGYASTYAPASVILDAGSAGGTYGFLNVRNIQPVPDEPFYGNRMDPNVKVPRYWELIPGTALPMAKGDRNLNLRFQMPVAEGNLINQTNGVVRRKSIPAETPEWQDRRGLELLWNIGTVATVELNLGTATSWPGFGDFFIGEKSARIFYSQGNGLWNDHSSWAFDAAGTIPAPVGEFPNPDWNSPEVYEFEIRDSVVIQNSDVITLNTRPELAYLDIQGDSKLVISDTTYLLQTHLGTSSFNMGDNATLELRTTDGIEPYTDGGANDGVVRFQDRTFAPTVNFGFTGSGDHNFGSAFPSAVNDIYVDSEGDAASITSIAPKDVTINGTLDLLSGNLRPRDNNSALHFVGDISINSGASYDATIDYLGNPVNTTNYIEGSGATNQVISGDGLLVFDNLEMNRGTGTGVLYVDKSLEIAGVLDMRSGTNANNQILEIGDNGNLSISSANPNAITDFGATNYIRTSETSGGLCREITVSEVYVYPLGSFDEGIDRYTPATLTSGATGTDGQVCVRTSRGSHATLAGGHAQLPVDRTEDYLRRYWAVTGVTTDISGRLSFVYDDSDIQADESKITSIGRWSNPYETAPGSWLAVSGSVTSGSNIIDTDVEIPFTDFTGDWTSANDGAFRSIFYSRQSGLWSDDNSWTYAKDHLGPIAGAGLFPAASKDSVVIGGGNNGVGDHIIRLDANYELGGVLVGTGTSNTGTLDLGEFVISGRSFAVNPNSTIHIGSPLGVNLIGDDRGNIQTTDVRDFGSIGNEINVVMSGTQSQILGSAFPENVNNLSVANTGANGDNTVLFDNNIRVNSNLNINSGVADIQNYSLNTSGTGDMNMLSGAWLRLNGANVLSNVINGYANYNLALGSVIEFYGDNQIISNLPANLTNGLATVRVNMNGTKFVSSSLLIRGDLYIENGATLQNDPAVDALQINGNVYNSALINNDGVIQLCN